jgi:cytochrome c oxidase assembly protein subunit 15
VSISHACIAQLFFSTTVAIALFTSPQWKRGPEYVDSMGWPARPGAVLCIPASVLGQLALGAAFRHKAVDLAPHAIGAAAVTAVVVYSAIFLMMHYPRHRALSGAAVALLAMTLAQVFLGIGAFMSRVATAADPQPMPVMVWFTVAHVAVGALTMAVSVVLAIQVYRHVRRPMREAPAHGLAVTR